MKGGVEMKKIIEWMAWSLVVIGALNWGLVGAFDFNLVATILGVGTLANIIYVVVGISAVILVVSKMMKK